MPPQAAPSPLGMMFPVLMMFLIFYVLVFRPQTKARKEHEQMVKHLKKHDEVVTTGGMFGTVVNVKPDAVTLRVDENVRIDDLLEQHLFSAIGMITDFKWQRDRKFGRRLFQNLQCDIVKFARDEHLHLCRLATALGTQYGLHVHSTLLNK